jgi:ankyrin repeat protein
MKNSQSKLSSIFFKPLKFIIFSFLSLSMGIVQAQSAKDLWIYVQNDRSDHVQKLLASGVDPNSTTGQGNPMIMQAVRDGAWAVFDVVLNDPRTDVNALNGYQETPLMYVSIVGDLARAKALVAKGALVNHLGWTPLHYAAAKGQLPVMTYLLSLGALPNAPAPNGTSPIMSAAQSGAIDAVQLLLSSGADPAAVDINGRNAADVARAQGHGTLAQALEDVIKQRQSKNIPQQ